MWYFQSMSTIDEIKAAAAGLNPDEQVELFRWWVQSDAFPDHVRVTFLDGEIYLDMSKEELETHNKVKIEVLRVLLNLNRVSVLLGVYSNLPWFLGPYYFIATMVGAQITGHRLPPGLQRQLRDLFELSLFQGEFWHRLAMVLRPLGLPYVVGSTIGAVLLAAAAYQVALAFIVSRRRLHDILQHHHHPKS